MDYWSRLDNDDGETTAAASLPPAQRKKLKELKWKEQRGKCAIGGEDLLVTGAELDRKDPVLGYTPENTQLVCHEHHREQQAKRGFA